MQSFIVVDKLQDAHEAFNKVDISGSICHFVTCLRTEVTSIPHASQVWVVRGDGVGVAVGVGVLDGVGEGLD